MRDKVIKFFARLDQPEEGNEQTHYGREISAQINRFERRHKENGIRSQYSGSNLEIPENLVKEGREGKG